MKTIQIRFLSTTALAVLVVTGSAAAQDTPSAVLNSLEVQQLVKRAEPADSARLASHFTALAGRYGAEARRHTSMAQSLVGNPSRSLANGMSTHCKRLADLNTQSATELGELAAYHRQLASGLDAPRPAGGARFEGGAGAPAPSDKDLAALTARASTPADHHALEEYFLILAGRYAADARAHSAFASGVRGTRIEHAAALHDRLARLSREAAKEANAAAEMHKQLANIGR